MLAHALMWVSVARGQMRGRSWPNMSDHIDALLPDGHESPKENGTSTANLDCSVLIDTPHDVSAEAPREAHNLRYSVHIMPTDLCAQQPK